VTIEAAEWVRVDGDGSAPVQVDEEIFGSLPVEIALNPPRPRLMVSTSKVDS